MLDIDIVKKAIELGHRYLAETVTRDYWWTVQFLLSDSSPLEPKLESPAEAVFEVCFTAKEFIEKCFVLDRQVEIETEDGQYRFDFVVSSVHHPHIDPNFADNKKRLKLAVEIDGHTWHEKTLEQVTYRNRRDRACQAAGYKVFHFSFSELMRDPMDCVDQVISAAIVLDDEGK